MSRTGMCMNYLMSIGGKDVVYRWHSTEKSLIWVGYDDVKHVIPLADVYEHGLKTVSERVSECAEINRFLDEVSE